METKCINSITFPMEIIGTHVAIPWDSCIPPFYGEYKGRLKDGRDCNIDVDWKITAYPIDRDSPQVGTDQIAYWLCSYANIKALIEAFERT